MELFGDEHSADDKPALPPSAKHRANGLDGREWIRNSISLWDDIRFSAAERALKHPAMFPVMLAERLIQCFTRSDETQVLDPFMGSGSTLLAARNLGRCGIGFELYDRFIALTNERLQSDLFDSEAFTSRIYQRDSRHLRDVITENSIDFVCTSPPYWDVLTQKRTADYKDSRSYGTAEDDLGVIQDYEEFLQQLVAVFSGVFQVLKPGKYCVVNVMDLRKKDRFFPLHMDLALQVKNIGFIFDDLIIWDRRKDYNNFRALGYPTTFRINKAHEFLLIFRKPKSL